MNFLNIVFKYFQQLFGLFSFLFKKVTFTALSHIITKSIKFSEKKRFLIGPSNTNAYI